MKEKALAQLLKQVLAVAGVPRDTVVVRRVVMDNVVYTGILIKEDVEKKTDDKSQD